MWFRENLEILLSLPAFTPSFLSCIFYVSWVVKLDAGLLCYVYIQ